MFDLVNDPHSDLYKKLDSRLKAFDEIVHFSAEPALINQVERRIFKDIKINDVQYFYLEDYHTGKNNQSLHHARYQLILQGMVISVMSNETEGYLIDRLEDVRARKIVNISYQAIRIPFIKKYQGKADENKWVPIWVEQYNEYLSTYFPKVFPHIASKQ